jgi:hypothetical protein
MIQPDFTPPAPSPKKILEAYPKLVGLLEEARADALGRLTWPMIVRSAERLISAMAARPAVKKNTRPPSPHIPEALRWTEIDAN